MLALLALLPLALAVVCPDTPSCETTGGDACCSPTAGLFVFRQRFEPDVGSDAGSWGIDGVDVLECGSQHPATEAVAPRYTHEEIGSLCVRSGVWADNFDAAEGEWASSEVGEGVEEVWERAWNTAGKFISTLGDGCVSKAEQPALFFHTLSTLHTGFPSAMLLANADLTAALEFGEHRPVLTCDNITLETIHWPLHSLGPFQSGRFKPATFDLKSNCPADGIIYPPSTTRARPTQTANWDPIYRPSPRPITLDHDESRQYKYANDHEAPQGKAEQLKIFKKHDDGREAGKEALPDKKFWRDEL
ncbi:hypothetical protein Q5752_003630 [Cryptotrichosporon argae]